MLRPPSSKAYSFVSSLPNYVCHLPNPLEVLSSSRSLQANFRFSLSNQPHSISLYHRVNRPPSEKKITSPRLIKTFASSTPSN